MYRFFTSRDIHPTGWLKQQLEIEARGLAGHLDTMWPDVRDSAWIGGSREGWERVPYWLDGFIPLAYLLEDEGMIRRAQRYVDAILDAQREDGWLCPCRDEERGDYDGWALFLISKVLVVYYDCSGDERVPSCLYRAMKNLKELMDDGTVTLHDWGRSRWFEAFIALQFLFRRCGEDWIPALARKLREQGTHYPDLAERWKRPMNQWTQETHVVNLAMMLKYEAVSCDLLGEPYTGIGEELLAVLERYNGTAVGTFTGDECLSGLSPIQGTELCAVVELMYSFEWLLARTGDSTWAERLERVAFNALPATLSDDMWTHQYDQMVNQIACRRFPGRSQFRTNNGEAHLFGLEPNYGCCTANFGQGWPKLALSAFLHSEEEIYSGVFVPAVLETKWKGTDVRLELVTKYPFREKLEYRITVSQPVDFSLRIRRPAWAETLRVNGELRTEGGDCVIRGTWEGTQTLRVEFGCRPAVLDRPGGMVCVERGPLVYAVPIEAEYRRHEYDRDGVERRYPYCDYELLPRTPWKYALASGELEAEEREGDAIPFSSRHPRRTLRAVLVPISWDFEDGFDSVCAKRPESAEPVGEPVSLSLFPYGCAKLRLTEMPLVKK